MNLPDLRNIKNYPDFIIQRTKEVIAEIAQCQSLSMNSASLQCLAKDVADSIFERGEPIELIITTCPDYSYELVNGKKVFTFGSIGKAIGLVGEEAFRNIAPLVKVLNKYSIHTKITFAYADIEAIDPDIIENMDISTQGFQELIEQSVVSAYLYAKNIFHEGQQDIFCTADSVKMSKRFFNDKEVSAFSEEGFSQLDSNTLTHIYIQRLKLLERMFKRVVYKRKNSSKFNENAFYLSRCEKDIKDHICIGLGIKKERAQGKKLYIVTLSIPHLANFFNYKFEEKSNSKDARHEDAQHEYARHEYARREYAPVINLANTY